MIARLQSHPLKRALRADKMTLAALEATLRLYLHPEALSEKLPTLRLLTRSAEVIQIRAQRLQAPLAAHYGAGLRYRLCHVFRRLAVVRCRLIACRARH